MAYGFAPSTITASTSLTRENHANGPWVRLSADTGLTVTLPDATGTGDIYKIVVITTVTANGYIVTVNNTDDSFYGGVAKSTDIDGITELAVAGDDTYTMSGTTTGGIKGSWMTFEDAGSGIWVVNGFQCSSGTEATGFSAS